MANGNLYKIFDSQTDVKVQQRVERDELFNPTKFIHKPWNASGSIEVTTSAVPIVSSSFYCEVGFVSRANSDITYMSFVRAESASVANSTGSGLMYHYIMNQLQPDNGSYEVSFDNYQATHDTIDVLAVSREFYKDGLDSRNFAVLVHNTASVTADSTLSGNLGLGTDVVALFPNYNVSENTPLGTKFYLYPTVNSGSIYNTATDEFNMKTPLDLDMDEPVGEIFVNAGLVFLFPEKLKEIYPAIETDDILSYVGGIGGRSLIQLNSTIYFARVLNTEFNYSTNPTFYEPDDETLVRENLRDDPVTYPTTIGLYNDRNELIAVGRVPQLRKKTFNTEAVFRLELAY